MKSYSVFLFALLLVVFMTPLVLSEIQTLGTFKQYTCVHLKQTCANCTFVNVTSVNVDATSTQVSSHVPMTKIGTEYNSTFCNTTYIGKYIVNLLGDPDGTYTVVAYDFSITPTGDTRGFGLWIALVLLGFFLLFADYFVRTNYLTFIGGIAFVLTGVYSMIYGIAGFAELWTRAVAVVIIGIGVIFMIGSAYDLVWGSDEEEGGYEEED